MMDELTALKKQVSELNDENLQLRSDVAYLKGKVEAYEWFLQIKGYIQGGNGWAGSRRRRLKCAK